MDHNSPKILDIYGYKILVNYTRGIISIDNNQSFQKLMNDIPKSGILELTTQAKRHYFEIYAEAIRITDRSLALEIWGHYFFEKYFSTFKVLFKKLGLKSIKNRLVQATDAFDCGEKAYDSNRLIWDFGAIFYPVISYFIRDNRK